MADALKILSNSEAETIEIGRKIGSELRGGEVVSLIGPLGSGKSVIGRGIAKGLGITGPVRSPSFNLMREYHGRLILRHWDLYRLESGFESLGILESSGADTVEIIEWAERWPLLEKYSTGSINLDYGDEESVRIILIEGLLPYGA
ncbi:MAG: tRNA (adenosine(37)-N6)-threonylcarbamoyltransferase complex ATPase subunit type 1 TsaE [bacterium]